MARGDDGARSRHLAGRCPVARADPLDDGARLILRSDVVDTPGSGAIIKFGPFWY
jgi:hypothetical protein